MDENDVLITYKDIIFLKTNIKKILCKTQTY
jgi:hypothetical protein